MTCLDKPSPVLRCPDLGWDAICCICVPAYYTWWPTWASCIEAGLCGYVHKRQIWSKAHCAGMSLNLPHGYLRRHAHSLPGQLMTGTVAGQDDVPEEMYTDCIDADACEAAPACSAVDGDTAAAAADPPKYIKGRLKAKLAFWKLYCTSTWVLSWISDGYQIPWGEWGPPPPHAYDNHQVLWSTRMSARKLLTFWQGDLSCRQTGHPWWLIP